MTGDPRKYRTIYRTLKQEIQDGKLKDGDQLLISELADRFEVSRDTVQAAIQLLNSDALAWRVPGLGWYVGQPDNEQLNIGCRELKNHPPH